MARSDPQPPATGIAMDAAYDWRVSPERYDAITAEMEATCPPSELMAMRQINAIFRKSLTKVSL